MGTGVKPIHGDYDIDVGIVFNLGSSHHEFPQPKVVKRWVYDAVRSHTRCVSWKEPCVTVQYQAGGEPSYHVDLAVYGKDAYGRLYLSRGKEHSSKSHWEEADPQGFTRMIRECFTGEDAAQFRRIIRYLKRWKDVHFSQEGNAAPVGIGLTILAYKSFQPETAAYPTSYDDLAALLFLVSNISESFRPQWAGGRQQYRISARLPVTPNSDVFARMTDQQCTEFKGRIDTLKSRLSDTARTGSTNPLRQAFGPDFPE